MKNLNNQLIILVYCEDGDEPAKDDVYGIHSVDFEPPNCQNVDNCAIHRGKNLIIRTLSFNSSMFRYNQCLQLVL